jgi:hypothetical protein
MRNRARRSLLPPAGIRAATMKSRPRRRQTLAGTARAYAPSNLDMPREPSRGMIQQPPWHHATWRRATPRILNNRATVHRRSQCFFFPFSLESCKVNGAGCHERGDVPGVTTEVLCRPPRRRRRRPPLTAARRATSPGSPGTGCRRSSTSSSSSRAPEQPRTHETT